MLANLRALFGVVIDIVLLRRGPEHLPASPALLAIVVVLYSVVTAVIANMVAKPDPRWPLILAFGVLGSILWYRVALQVAGKRERFVQTMLGLFAVRLLFAPVLSPLATSVMLQLQAQQTPPALLQLMVLGLAGWWIAANGQVVKSAFEWPWIAAIAMVLIQEFALVLGAAMVFGGEPQALEGT
jgi:hypothetical protein